MEVDIEFEDSRINFFLQPSESERNSTYGEKLARRNAIFDSRSERGRLF